MKKLVTILLLMVLISCGSSPSRTIPTSNSDYENIIGVPIKIENLEVAQYDFPNKMNWYVANRAFHKLGDGWRLPTKDELNTLYQNKTAIGGFENDFYWSSTQSINLVTAWYQYFYDGDQGDASKDDTYCVRAIRTF